MIDTISLQVSNKQRKWHVAKFSDAIHYMFVCGNINITIRSIPMSLFYLHYVLFVNFLSYIIAGMLVTEPIIHLLVMLLYNV